MKWQYVPVYLILGMMGCAAEEQTGLMGKVTLDGKPLAGFQVTLFNSDQNRGGVGGAIIKADGSYEIKGVLPGSYKVIIDRFRGPLPPGVGPPEGPERLPPRYSDFQATEFSVVLEQSRTSIKDFLLQNDAPPPS